MFIVPDFYYNCLRVKTPETESDLEKGNRMNNEISQLFMYGGLDENSILAKLGEIFVNDAFGTAHRAHCSTAGLASYMPAVSGFLIEKEVKFLGQAVEDPERPFCSL